MYESFFGLRERPFDLTPNPRFLMMMGTHREALANLQYGMTGRKGLTLLLGDAGAGKTTLVRTALEQWREAGHLVAYLNNPTLTRDEFVEYLTASFALSPAAATSKTRFLSEFTTMVTERHEKGQITGLLIDEAQSLSTELLEEVRLLVNIETATAKMFQVVLAGQPELATRLNEPGLRQLKQRVALRCTLATLTEREAAEYIAGRIQIAGGIAGHLFTREAVMAVHEHSGGIPRVISVICDNALLAGFAAGRRPVMRDAVEEVCRDFDLQRAAAPVEPADGAARSYLDAGPAPVSKEPPVARTPVTPATLTDNRPSPVTAEPSVSAGLFEMYAPRTKRRFSFF